MTPAPALEVDHVTKWFRRHREGANSLKQLITAGRAGYEKFVALRDVSFQVNRGEVFGVIGHNGSGKSTLLKCMAGILHPNEGAVRVHDRMSALLELGAGFHPDLTGRENVFLNAALLGMQRREIATRYDEIVSFSGLDPAFLEAPVKTYSSGMYVRLAFSIAINVEPELLIVDEILAVGDLNFQEKCTEKFVEFRNAGKTIVLVTHDLDSVRSMCDRAVWLHHGELRGGGDPSDMVDAYTDQMTPQVQRQVALGDHRKGSGEIEFIGVDILSDGAPTTRCRTGTPITVRLSMLAHQPVDDPTIAVAIVGANGMPITAPTSREGGLQLDTVRGTVTLDMTVDDLTLLPGHYQLNCSISDRHRQHVFDFVRSATSFDVLPGTPFEAQGQVTMRPRWSRRG